MSFKAICGTVLALVFAGSVGTRAVMDSESKPSQSTTKAAAGNTSQNALMNNLTSSDSARESTATPVKSEGEVSGLEKYLPTITEASFFAIIGFAIGYATRKLVKILLIVLALVFAGVMALWHFGIISEPNWGRAVELVNEWVLNFKKDQPVTEWIKNRIPSAGGFLAGVLLGYRKG